MKLTIGWWVIFSIVVSSLICVILSILGYSQYNDIIMLIVTAGGFASLIIHDIKKDYKDYEDWQKLIKNNNKTI